MRYPATDKLEIRPVEIPGMKEAHQPIVGAIQRASDKIGNVRRPDQPIPSNDTHDLHVVIREPEWRRLGSAAKARSAYMRSSSGLHTPQF
jgi:hypothetical protein